MKVEYLVPGGDNQRVNPLRKIQRCTERLAGILSKGAEALSGW